MQHLSSRRSQRGFTLIELLLVIGIIAILAAIVIVAINPTKQLGSARNAQRRADVNTIINAIYQYAIDKAQLPATLPASPGASPVQICKTTYFPQLPVVWNPANPAGPYECVNLRMLSGTYVVSMPIDPYNAPLTSSGYTGYVVSYDTTTKRVTVTAPRGTTEPVAETISVSR